MTTDNPPDDLRTRALKEKMAAVNPMFQWLGIEVVRAGTQSARFAMPVTERHANTFGVCHGGIVFAFADLAFGFTSNATGEKAVTASASIEFLKQVPLNVRLIAEVTQTAVSGRNGFYDVVLTIENAPDDVVGLVRGRMRLLGGPVVDEA